MSDSTPYRVQSNPESNSFAVVGTDDRTVVTCAHQQAAEHYTALLNQAFKAGFRQGYREANGKKK